MSAVVPNQAAWFHDVDFVFEGSPTKTRHSMGSWRECVPAYADARDVRCKLVFGRFVKRLEALTKLQHPFAPFGRQWHREDAMFVLLPGVSSGSTRAEGGGGQMVNVNRWKQRSLISREAVRRVVAASPAVTPSHSLAFFLPPLYSRSPLFALLSLGTVSEPSSTSDRRVCI